MIISPDPVRANAWCMSQAGDDVHRPTVFGSLRLQEAHGGFQIRRLWKQTRLPARLLQGVEVLAPLPGDTGIDVPQLRVHFQKV